MTVADIARIIEILPVPINHAPWSWEPWAFYPVSTIGASGPPMILSRFFSALKFSDKRPTMSFGVQHAATIALVDLEHIVLDEQLIAMAQCRLDCALASINDKYGMRRP
jgi:hypothetical protein